MPHQHYSKANTRAIQSYQGKYGAPSRMFLHVREEEKSRLVLRFFKTRGRCFCYNVKAQGVRERADQQDAREVRDYRAAQVKNSGKEAGQSRYCQRSCFGTCEKLFLFAPTQHSFIQRVCLEHLPRPCNPPGRRPRQGATRRKPLRSEVLQGIGKARTAFSVRGAEARDEEWRGGP